MPFTKKNTKTNNKRSFQNKIDAAKCLTEQNKSKHCANNLKQSLICFSNSSKKKMLKVPTLLWAGIIPANSHALRMSLTFDLAPISHG